MTCRVAVTWMRWVWTVAQLGVSLLLVVSPLAFMLVGSSWWRKPPARNRPAADDNAPIWGKPDLDIRRVGGSEGLSDCECWTDGCVAEGTLDGKRVVLKAPKAGEKHAEFRIRKEAHLLNTFSQKSPNVIGFHGMAETKRSKEPVLALEWMPKTASDMPQEVTSLSEHSIACFMASAAEATATLHEAGAAHSEGPHSFVFDAKFKRAKLIDLSRSRYPDAPAESMSADVRALGSLLRRALLLRRSKGSLLSDQELWNTSRALLNASIFAREAQRELLRLSSPQCL